MVDQNGLWQFKNVRITVRCAIMMTKDNIMSWKVRGIRIRKIYDDNYVRVSIQHVPREIVVASPQLFLTQLLHLSSILNTANLIVQNVNVMKVMMVD